MLVVTPLCPTTTLPDPKGSPASSAQSISSSPVHSVPRDLPNFRVLGPNLYIRDSASSENVIPDHHPRFILLFGWGDVLPQHIAKYVDGFTALFPHSPQIIYLSRLGGVWFTTLAQRARAVSRILPVVYPDGPLRRDDRVLVHAMSNGGSVYYSGLLYTYRTLYGTAMPHRLLSLDSTPGGTDHTLRNIYIWAGATALRLAKVYHVPFLAAHAACLFVVLGSWVNHRLRGETFSGAWASAAVNDATYNPKTARKLYLYSNADSVIDYRDVELHAAETRRRGWEADLEMFEGTEHVSHLRKYPEQYWRAVARAWEMAMSGGS